VAGAEVSRRQFLAKAGLAGSIAAAAQLGMLALEVRILTRFDNLSIGTGFAAGLGGVVAAGVTLAVLRSRARSA
jgi:hypothetical protein